MNFLSLCSLLQFFSSLFRLPVWEFLHLPFLSLCIFFSSSWLSSLLLHVVLSVCVCVCEQNAKDRWVDGEVCVFTYTSIDTFIHTRRLLHSISDENLLVLFSVEAELVHRVQTEIINPGTKHTQTLSHTLWTVHTLFCGQWVSVRDCFCYFLLFPPFLLPFSPLLNPSRTCSGLCSSIAKVVFRAQGDNF